MADLIPGVGVGKLLQQELLDLARRRADGPREGGVAAALTGVDAAAEQQHSLQRQDGLSRVACEGCHARDAVQLIGAAGAQQPVRQQRQRPIGLAGEEHAGPVPGGLPGFLPLLVHAKLDQRADVTTGVDRLVPVRATRAA